jgi:diguanylate cyclase (GGDEF)-like protein
MAEKKKILIISSDKNLRDVLDFCFKGWGYDVHFFDHLAREIDPIKRMFPDTVVIDIHTANKQQLEICRLLKEDFATAAIPIITLINKKQLRSQLLNLKQGVDDYLIKPPDPLDLRIRIEMTMRRAQYSFFASPLTRLPGSRNIEEALKGRIALKESFSFGYIDIDGFKYFNDAYGYIKGDRAIMQTAYILYTVIRHYGNKNDFIGHVGGDDFAFITTPDKYKLVCDNMIALFDKIMPFHYSQKDRKRGYVVARDRTHRIKNIPIMTISIAIATGDKQSNFKNVIQVNEKVAEIKRYLKSFPGSKFMEDRRNKKKAHAMPPQIHKPAAGLDVSYKPLGQILLEKKMISPEKLDEALCLHWKRGILLGDILKEKGYVKEHDIKSALKCP